MLEMPENAQQESRRKTVENNRKYCSELVMAFKCRRRANTMPAVYAAMPGNTAIPINTVDTELL